MQKPTNEEIEVYKERFLHEYDLIKKCGYIRYFLIISDLIKYFKENGVLVNFGRGSISGSLISYIMGITAVNPIEHDLSFARFLNEGRLQFVDGKWSTKSMVDCDIDVCHDKKDFVRERVKNLYGEYNVCGVSTVLHMNANAVVRDVARTFEINLAEVNNFCKLIISDIESALETEEGKAFRDKYPDVIRHSLKLSNKPKTGGVHPAACCLFKDDLRDTDCGHFVRTKDGSLALNWDMNDCENQGGCKIDLLSLSTLTIVAKCLEIIEKNHGIKIDIEKLDINDHKVYEEIDKGNITGLFQLDTYVGRSLVNQMKIDQFNDLPALLAISRPGPANAGVTAEFIKRKNSGTWDKKHPVLEEICSRSAGLVIYQEQILGILNRIAGFSLADSDKVRKLVAKKKDKSEFEPHRIKFIDGCKKVGYFSKEEAEKFWEELLFCSDYLFSVNHSVAYSMLTFTTGYLSAYYPLEFYCANLTYAASDKKPDLIKEIVKLGLKIQTPRVGKSHATEWVVKDNVIYIPFSEIHGIAEKTAIAAAQSQKTNDGFFNISGKQKKSSKLETILDEINAFNDLPPKAITFSDFEYDLIKPWQEKQPRLLSLKNEFNLHNTYDELNTCENISIPLIKLVPKPKNYLRGLGVCQNCSLNEDSRNPVKPSFGKYNVMIIGEASHWVDDKTKIPLNSDEGTKALFPLLKRFGLTREMFYVTNCVKCVVKKVSKENIISCNDWLTKEIEYVKPKIVLAFGNTGLKFFAGVDSGIKRMNGTTEWNETFGCWVCYCVRPVTALFDDSGKEELKFGIRNFVKKVRKLGLKDMEY